MRRIGLFLFLMCAIASNAGAQAPNTISTYAGGGVNGSSAVAAHTPQVYKAVRDTSGNTYLSVPSLGIVYKVNGSGTMTVYAGTGTLGFSGDDGPAASAVLDYPTGLALDSSGNLYIADSTANRIRKVTASTGVITTVAGSGDEYNGVGFFGGYSGDGGAATDALLNGPTDVVVDPNGDLYIADRVNQVVRFVSAGTGTISTYAGTGGAGYSGDGGPATSATFRQPSGVTLDSSGNLFIADKNNCIVRRVDAITKIITTYAGTPQTCGFSGDSGAAISAELNSPLGVFADAAGFLFIADSSNNRIREVDNTTQHDISTVAGTGASCATATGCGDGGAATSALLNGPKAVFEDSSNILLIADTGDMRVRTVTSGTIANDAGSGTGGDGGAATSSILSLPYIANVDSSGNLFILDSFGGRVQRVDGVTHDVTTFAGNGVLGVAGSSNGDGGQATAGKFIYPIAMAFDSAGNMYVADQSEYVVRKITLATGIITTIAGNGQQCGATGNPNQFPGCGDGGAATSASLYCPVGLAVDSNNNVFIADQCLNRIREVFIDGGGIQNYAGSPSNTSGYAGDNGPPSAALLNSPFGLAFNAGGDLFIADAGNNVVRRIFTENDIIETYAFNGEPTFGGDGGSATGASMYSPLELAFDPAGNLFVGGGNDNVVRRIDMNDTSVITAAGNVDNLDGGFSGDGGPATQALLSNFGLSVDANENLYIADTGNNRIRKVHMVPVASWTPTTLTAFPALLAGQVSDSQDITFSNSGLNDLTVSLQSVSADFAVTNLCAFVPATPLGSCDLLVSFVPPVGVGTGPVSGTLVLATNDPNNPTVTFALSGTIASTGFTLTVFEVVPAPNTAIVSSDPAGIISCGQAGGTCSASFASETVVTLIASALPGYSFLGWSANCAPVTNLPFECTTTMSQAQTVTATFGASTLTVSSLGNGSGTITSNPAGISCPPTCTFTFSAGTQTVTLTATPNTNSVFVGWSDYYCTNTTGNTCTITLSNYFFNETATAVFSVARKPFSKGDLFIGSTAGMIFEYNPSGTLVQVLPSLNFNSFAGFVYGMTFDKNGTLYAANPSSNATAGLETFASTGTGPAAFGGTSTVSAGSVRVDPSGNVFVGLEANSATGNLLEFAPGDTTGPTSYFFPAYYKTSGVFAFEIAQDDVTMFYTLGTNSLFSYNTALGLQNPDLTDSLPGVYAGDLRQLPDGTILLADGDRVVRLNSTTGAVIQTYQPTAFSLLLGLTLDSDGVDFWTDDSITGVAYKINISSGAIVTQFNTQLGNSAFGGLVGLGGIAEYGSPASGGEDLSVALAGTGAGSVSSNPVGISCGTTCTANYAVGQQVTLTAAPVGGSTFTGWSGACTGTSTCTVTMSQAQAVTATFSTAANVTLTVVLGGTAYGTVIDNAGKINCTDNTGQGTTGTCTATYPSGTQVTLTQTANPGSAFASWTATEGDFSCPGVTATCTITMDEQEEITATFNNGAGNFTLNITTGTNASGGGLVTGSIGSTGTIIDCTLTGTTESGTCSQSLASGSIDTLTAEANATSTFTGWTGPCALTSLGKCVVTMGSAQTVTATFTAQENPFTVTIAGLGSVTSTSNPTTSPEINCANPQPPSVCSANFVTNTSVTLTATPGTGQLFSSWTAGPCSGETVNTCTFTVNTSSPTSATASFVANTYLLTVVRAGALGGTITSNAVNTEGGGITCGPAAGVSGCSVFATYNTQVILTETPPPGGTFGGWSGTPTGCVVSGATCTFNMPAAAETVTGTFNAAVTTFALTVTDAGTGTGAVTSQAGLSPVIDCVSGSTTGCSQDYDSGQSVTLTAAPTGGSTFAGWSGACTGTSTCTVTMSAPETVTATFNSTTPPSDIRSALVPFTGDGSAPVTVTWTPAFDDTNYTAVCTAETTPSDFLLPVITGRTATSMTVIPTGGGATPGVVDCIAIPDSDTSDIQHNRTAFSDTPQTVNVTWTSPFANTSYTVACTVENDQADSNDQFTSVISDMEEGLVAVDNGQIAAGTMHCIAVPDTTTTAMRHARAGLSGQEPTVTLQWNNAFPNASYAAACSEVQLDQTSSDAAIAIDLGMKLPASVGVVDEISSGTIHCLAVTAAPTLLSLTVTPNPATVQAGSTLQFTATGNYSDGSTQNLTTTATWSSSNTSVATIGNTTGTQGLATGVQLGDPVTITATDGSLTGTATLTVTAAPQFTLTVTLAGTGGGSVTSSPQGINCGSACSSSFTSGQVVTLMATPFTGSVFAGWSGAGCTGTGNCTVTVTAAETVTATFNLPPPGFTLTVTLAQASQASPGGTGTVTSQSGLSPAIDCPDTCSASYVSGTVVTLTATPASGSAFTGWSGACTGTGACTVTMNAAESVTATFNTSTFTFTTGPGYTTTTTTTPGGNIVVGFTLSSTTPTTVDLECTSSAPQYLSCLITPTVVNLTGNGPAQVAIVLTSYCQGSAPGMPGGPAPGIPGGIVGVTLLGLALGGVAFTYRGRRRLALSFAVMLLAAVAGAACGNLPQGTAGPTPPGNYTLTVTATVAGQAPQSVVLNVTVK